MYGKEICPKCKSNTVVELVTTSHITYAFKTSCIGLYCDYEKRTDLTPFHNNILSKQIFSLALELGLIS